MARMLIDGEVLMASDAPPDHFHQPQGFAVSLQVDDPADAERKFKALAEGGTVNMPFGKTFFSKGFGMCVDQFGMPWMVNCPMENIRQDLSIVANAERTTGTTDRSPQVRGRAAAAGATSIRRGG